MPGKTMNKTLLAVLFTVVVAFGREAVLRSATDEQEPVDSSQQIYDRIVNSSKPVLIDFWAPWCAPCRMLNPVLKELEKKYAGRVIFLKVNVDIHRGLANYFRVQGIPAVFFVKDKSVVNALVGFHPKAAYAAVLDSLVKKIPVLVPAKPAAPPAPAPSAKPRKTY